MIAQTVEVSSLNLPTHPLNTSWVIVDSSIDNLETLAGFAAKNNRVFLLDSWKDGVEQITQWLHQSDDAPTVIHLVSHGAPGTLYLGNGELSLGNLTRYADFLKTWSVRDLFIYGCNVASGDAGEEFLRKLHGITQAHIAAASHTVGSPSLGGDWNLNIQLGDVESAAFVTPEMASQYQGVFASSFVTTEDNANNSSDQNTATPTAADRVPDRVNNDPNGEIVGDFGRGIRVGANGARLTDANKNTLEDYGAIQPIEFYIDTDVAATMGESFLLLSVFDVDADAANPEEDLVTFNGTQLGLLEGEDNLSVRTVFNLNNSLIRLGANFVQIDVNIQNYPNNWEAEIERAELVINYIRGETLGAALLDVIQTDQPNYAPGATVQFTADVDTTQSPNQLLDLEVILRDPSGTAVAFADVPNYLVTGNTPGLDGDELLQNFVLPANAPVGTWTIDISAFDEVTDAFQFLATQPFNVGQSGGDGAAFLDPAFGGGDGLQTDKGQYSPGETVQFTADIDTTQTPDQLLNLEVTLRDAGGNAVDVVTVPGYQVTGDTAGLDGDELIQNFTLPNNASGRWSIDISAVDASTGDPQFSGSQGFDVGAVQAVPVPSPGPLVFQFKDFVIYENLDDGRPYQGHRATFDDGLFGQPKFVSDEELYLLANQDIAESVQRGEFATGLEHYQTIGMNEGRNKLPLNFEVGGLRISYLFDETYYLGMNSDVANGIGNGPFVYGYDHFIKFGIIEGRNPSLWYDEAFYLANNDDVRQGVANGAFRSGLEHYLLAGHIENRDPSALFDADDYLANNPDVQVAIANGDYQSGFDHFIEAGASEGRLRPSINPGEILGTLLFEESFYLNNNGDVAAAVQNGQFQSGFEHYIVVGQSEGRNPAPFFDESDYLGVYQDVAPAVPGVFSSGMEHYFRAGRQEDRLAFEVPAAEIFF
jgi:hypothetical protein